MFIEALEAGFVLINNEKAIRKGWRSLKKALGNELRILVFGASGTGKSTLGAFLKTDRVDVGQAYRISLRREKYSFSRMSQSTIYVVPGQESLGQNDWNQMFNLLAKGRISGVINVVAAGYHSRRVESYKETETYRRGKR